MTPRPLYCWKSFWLGILVLGFLYWAWLDSLWACRAFSWERTESALVVMRTKGVTWVRIIPSNVTRVPRGASEWMAIPRRDVPNVEKQWEEARRSGRGPRIVRILDAVVLISFLIPWASFLAWRWRRHSNKSQSAFLQKL
jgi:hypothetical protein